MFLVQVTLSADLMGFLMGYSWWFHGNLLELMLIECSQYTHMYTQFNSSRTGSHGPCIRQTSGYFLAEIRLKEVTPTLMLKYSSKQIKTHIEIKPTENEGLNTPRLREKNNPRPILIF